MAHVAADAVTKPARRVRGALLAFWRKAYEDNVTGLSSMVAYSLLLSVFPFALVALFIAGRILRSEELQASVLADLKRIFPTAAESTLSEGIRRLERTSPTVGILAVVASIWFGSTFWGALDTAFCRIYHCECRKWVQQKLFAFGMFGILCAIYRLVPKAKMPWRAIWPGALGATIAIGIVDLCFPLYLDNVSTLRIGTSAVFVLIALVWFYALALILLSGAVINELRLERRSRSQ